MAKLLSTKDVAIRAIETGVHPDVYCLTCRAWVPFDTMRDGEHCPACGSQADEAKQYKLGLASLSEAEAQAAQEAGAARARTEELKTSLLAAYIEAQDARETRVPGDEQPVLKYGNQVLHAPQTSAGTAGDRG